MPLWIPAFEALDPSDQALARSPRRDRLHVLAHVVFGPLSGSLRAQGARVTFSEVRLEKGRDDPSPLRVRDIRHAVQSCAVVCLAAGFPPGLFNLLGV